MTEPRIYVTAPPGDYHANTANHDPEFHKLMDTFCPDWRTSDPKIIRNFAKRYNFWKLYGSRGPVTVTLDGREIARATAREMPKIFQTRGVTDERVAPVVDINEGVAPPPTAIADTPGTVDPPPVNEVADSPAKPAVWASVPMTVRQWSHGGLKSIVCIHQDMASVIIPIEVLYALANGFMQERACFEPGADDTVSETMAEEYRVRPDAVMQATNLATHICNAFPR